MRDSRNFGEARPTNQGILSISPVQIISYAEVLSPEVKQFLQESFHVQIHEVYKCSEGLMGVTCKYGNMHINEDVVLLEVVNKNGTPVPAGTPGHARVTDLVKRATPMIRYQLNDVLTLSPDKCPCGSHFRVIEQIQGRSDDMFLGKRIGIKKAQFIFADYIRRAIVSSSDHIREYRGVQISPTEIALKIDLLPEYNTGQEKAHIESKVITKINQVFTKQSCEIPKITFEYMLIEHDFNLKLRRFNRAFAEKEFF